jgi:hypothetical protein
LEGNKTSPKEVINHMKKTKEPYIPLTIDEAATKARILEHEGTVAKFVRRRRMIGATVCMILNGKYPKSVNQKSKYQLCLRKFAEAGYLVPECTEQSAAA